MFTYLLVAVGVSGAGLSSVAWMDCLDSSKCFSLSVDNLCDSVTVFRITVKILKLFCTSEFPTA